MDPAKLKAYVDKQSASPALAAMGAPAAAAEPDDDVDDTDPGDDEDDLDDAPDPVARGNELLASWGDDGAALKEDAGDIVDDAHDVGGNMLVTPVPEDTTDELEDAYDKLGDDVQICLAKYVADLPAKDLSAVAAALCADHDGDTETPDPKLIATYLKALAATAKEEVDPDDLVDEDAPDAPDGAADQPSADTAAPSAATDASVAAVPPTA